VRDHEKLQIIWLITSYWVPLIRQECNKLAICQKVRKHGHVLLKLLPSQSHTEKKSLILPMVYLYILPIPRILATNPLHKELIIKKYYNVPKKAFISSSANGKNKVKVIKPENLSCQNTKPDSAIQQCPTLLAYVSFSPHRWCTPCT